MTRRDTIILAVLINTALLVILFITTMDFNETVEEKSVISQAIIPATPIDLAMIPLEQTTLPNQSATEPSQSPLTEITGDEVDNVLSQYAAETNSSGIKPSRNSNPPSRTSQSSTENASTLDKSQENTSTQLIEVTVKKGDSLDKISRANGTTIQELMKANHLTSPRLDIGQVLLVPKNSKKQNISKKVNTPKEKGTKEKEQSKSSTLSKEKEKSSSGAKNKTASAVKAKEAITASGEPQYYTIKPGDNPWKLARQFHVKFDDLLKLNGLNEEKARNLKVGDKIRVR